MASPVPTLAAREAARLTDAAYAGDIEEVHRDQLALAALLSGYAIDAAWYGLHHVMSQTLVRVGGAGHGPANAAMLPHTIAALERRRPGYVDPDESLRALARRLAELAGADGDPQLGVEQDRLRRLRARRRPARRARPHAAARRRGRAARPLREGVVSLELLQDLMAKARGPLRLRRGAPCPRALRARVGPQRRRRGRVGRGGRGHRRARAHRRRLGIRRHARRLRRRRRGGAERARSRSPRPSRPRPRPPLASAGEPARGHWESPCEQDPFAVSLDDRLAHLFAAEEAHARRRADRRARRRELHARSARRRPSPSTEGAACTQALTECGGGIAGGRRRRRRAAGPLVPELARRRMSPRQAGSTCSSSISRPTPRAWPRRRSRCSPRPSAPQGHARSSSHGQQTRAPGARVDRPRARARPHPARRSLLRRHELRQPPATSARCATAPSCCNVTADATVAGRPRLVRLGRRGRGRQAHAADRPRACCGQRCPTASPRPPSA